MRGFHLLYYALMCVNFDYCRGIASDILKDSALAAAVWGIGAHYPGVSSSSQAQQTHKPLWASEDDSTYK